ncbi:MAG: hypothetical protein Q4C47_05205 [Planctomycetia bacterium]|nr:hypothetical protein [Planctomycetia bacterium]
MRRWNLWICYVLPGLLVSCVCGGAPLSAEESVAVAMWDGAVAEVPDSGDVDVPDAGTSDADVPDMDVLDTDVSEMDTPAPEFLVYSTRCTTPRWYRRVGRGGFRSTEDGWAVLASDPTTPLVILVHGNQTSLSRSMEMGCDLWRCLRRQGEKFRLLVWSWDADRACLSVQMDSRIKASRADAQGTLLAGFLRMLPRETPVVLIGYSFGCRTIGGAAQLDAGGEWMGKIIASGRDVADVRPMSLILVAAAMDDTGFQSWGAMNVALNVADDCVLTVNPCDQALGLYPVISDTGRPAMGQNGPSAVPADNAGKIQLLDVSDEVGPIHQWECYFGSCALRCQIVRAVRSVTCAAE